MISQIAAMSRNRVIGRDNTLPWHMPDDLAYFFRVTKERHIIMGRRNYEANGKALPGRVNIVVTRNKDYHAPGCIVVHSVQEALDYAKKQGEKEVFIVGGGVLYAATLDITDRIYLTLIDAYVEGDTFFPELDPKQWQVVFEEFHPADERNPYNYTFYIFERKPELYKS
ncbi:MAG TPA: type 3 dihydrofolate reductase [Bacteroidetes bacterium]|nr:type 3 dihydrofolate reductase [Bacteroidota bacterium]